MRSNQGEDQLQQATHAGQRQDKRISWKITRSQRGYLLHQAIQAKNRSEVAQAHSSSQMLPSLKERYDEALRRDDVKAIVVTGAGGKFSGGFDITTFPQIQAGKVQGPPSGYVVVDILTDIVDASRKPSVAAVDGLALGGGLDVAMACHARISTPIAQLGLHELQLGVILGFGVSGKYASACVDSRKAPSFF